MSKGHSIPIVVTISADEVERFVKGAVERLGPEIDDLRRKATQRGARLQVLRNWMSHGDWHLFCRAHPEAVGWFDSDGMPK